MEGTAPLVQWHVREYGDIRGHPISERTGRERDVVVCCYNSGSLQKQLRINKLSQLPPQILAVDKKAAEGEDGAVIHKLYDNRSDNHAITAWQANCKG
jgi:hypothetical protein